MMVEKKNIWAAENSYNIDQNVEMADRMGMGRSCNMDF